MGIVLQGDVNIQSILENCFNNMANKLDDHHEKFSHIEEYFKLTEVLLKDNGVIDYSFTCVKCLPTMQRKL